MKAVQMSRFGGPEVLEVIEMATPSPGPGQVLVRTHAIGVNFAETLMRENRYALAPVLPAVLGSEAAGTIESLGSGVAGLEIGARVAVPLFAAGRFFGGYADHVLVDASWVVKLPPALAFEQATALMVQGLTALHLTRQAAPRGKSVLISAAAGGVGSLLVQLARRAGARTIIAAAGAPEKLAFARALGADAAVDYTQRDWVAQARAATAGAGPDIIYESAGGAVTGASLQALAQRGELVIYGALNIQDFHLGVPELTHLIFNNQSVTGFALVPLLDPKSLQADLGALFELAVRRELKVKVGAVYPLSQAGEAHRALEGRRSTGKLVLVPEAL